MEATTTDTGAALASEAARRVTAALEAGELVSVGTINALFAPLRVDGAGLAQLGFGPIATLRAAKLYRSADLPHIRAALVQHLTLLAPGGHPPHSPAALHLQSEATQAVVLPITRNTPQP